MPKAKTSKRTRRVRNRATFFYHDDPCKDEGIRDITVARSAGGRIRRTTTLSKLNIGTSINADLSDPWTLGFFDSNTEAGVADSNDLPPVWAPDELVSDPLESLPEPKERRMVRTPFTFECSLIDKDF
jgi:hypothetical protein